MTGDLDGRFLLLLAWGGSCLATYGLVFYRRLLAWRRHHDIRSRRRLVTGFALLLVSFGAAASIALALFAQTSGIRGVMGAMALGAFVAAGFVMAGETPKEEA